MCSFLLINNTLKLDEKMLEDDLDKNAINLFILLLRIAQGTHSIFPLLPLIFPFFNKTMQFDFFLFPFALWM